MALVQFELTPLDQVVGWGEPPNLSLHWFGLSDGTYHLDLGDVRLLEYRPHVNVPRFVDYNLARIHEDLVGMLPDVLQPIPEAVSARFRDGSLGSTLRQLRETWEEQDDDDPDLDAALEVLGNRPLDTGYLSPSAGIWIWSDDAKVVIEWDNRGRLIDGKPAWTATHGRKELARDQFVEELRDFHLRLMAAMEERVQQVCANWTRPDVKINFRRLAEEQVERSGSFEPALRLGRRTTDWQAVLRGLNEPA
jgi:hypothetical protein